LKPLDIAMISLSAALYTVVGILTSLGLVSPVVGVVRFWPAVVVPAIFAVLFGPLVGGISAAIGIFISDMVYPGHGIALLSLTVGVPSNFLGFYLIGYVSRIKLDWKKTLTCLAAGCIILASIIYLAYINILTMDVSLLFTSVLLGSYLLAAIVGHWFSEWRSYELASIIGLGVGSAWIGFGLWAYSQLFPLPLTLGVERNAPFYAAFMWFVWTFSTEIPFLITIVPPILKACYRAFPFLIREENEETKHAKAV